MPGCQFAQSAEADLAGIVDYTVQTWGPAQAYIYINGLEKLAASVAVDPLRLLFASRSDVMGQVLGIVYRCITTRLIRKAGFSRKTT